MANPLAIGWTKQIILGGPKGGETEAKRRLAEVLYEGHYSQYAPHGMNWEGLSECYYLDDSGKADEVAIQIASEVDYIVIEPTRLPEPEPRFRRHLDARGRPFYTTRKGAAATETKWKKDLERVARERKKIAEAAIPQIQIEIVMLRATYVNRGSERWWSYIENDRQTVIPGSPVR